MRVGRPLLEGTHPGGMLNQRAPFPCALCVNQGLPQTAQTAGIPTCVSAETAVGGSSLAWNPSCLYTRSQLWVRLVIEKPFAWLVHAVWRE